MIFFFFLIIIVDTENQSIEFELGEQIIILLNYKKN